MLGDKLINYFFLLFVHLIFRTKRYGEELIKTIYAEFTQRCTVKPLMYPTNSENILRELKSCLGNELRFNIKNSLIQSSTELRCKRFLNELNTDVAYLNIL